MTANIGPAEVALTFVVSAVVLAEFVGLVALGVRLGTRGPPAAQLEHLRAFAASVRTAIVGA